MAEYQQPVLGDTFVTGGDVTQNRWVGARSARNLERSVGYGAGRLSAGWAVLLLKEVLVPGDFKFGGLTLRSGGREGLPAATRELDEQRRHVDEAIRAGRSADEYLDLQKRALKSITVTGEDRLVKIRPVTQDDPDLAPKVQYPMGAGGLQWTLIKRCKFLVALKVDANGIATIASDPPQSVSLGESAAYDQRSVVARFLNTA